MMFDDANVRSNFTGINSVLRYIIFDIEKTEFFLEKRYKQNSTDKISPRINSSEYYNKGWMSNQ